MPIDALYPDAVAYVMGDRDGVRRPIGTAFLVGVQIDGVADRVFVYAVTARHVVPTGSPTWIRANGRDGGIRDLEIPNWTRHSKYDVAVTRVTTGLDEVRTKHFAMSQAADPGLMELGDRVYFIGLYAGISAGHTEVVPVVRGGTLARIHQAGIPIDVGGMTEYTVAHLIDGFPLGGFSGSPCFVQYDRVKIEFHDPDNPRVDAMRISLEHDTMLCGLISGHFYDRSPVDIDGSPAPRASANLHAGIGIVTPVESILELLNEPSLVAERRWRAAELAAEERG